MTPRLPVCHQGLFEIRSAIVKPVVIKRDGCRVPFNGMRIIEAVAKSAEAVGIKDLAYCASIAEQITQQLAGRDEVAIHDIQNMVENLLMAGERKEMARAYIEYRHDRDMAREKQGRLSQEIRGLIEQSNADRNTGQDDVWVERVKVSNVRSHNVITIRHNLTFSYPFVYTTSRECMKDGAMSELA